MSSVALFPGRFQPPHIGHILTLMRLYPLYDEIIITVSTIVYLDGTKYHIIKPSEVAEILKEVFQFLPKFRVIGPGPGFVERADPISSYPYFDEVVSGTPVVIQHAKKLGIKCVYVPPSTICGMEICATILRKVLDGAG